jgi:DNA-binding MarR family transcriptional regulator
MANAEDHVRIVPLLERATHAVGLHMEQSLHELGITQAEAHILGALAEIGECSINDLHAGFGHKRSTLTSILDRLEGRGFIERIPHPTSRRSVMIRLTESGTDAARQVTGILQAIEAAVAARVSPGDLEGFRRVIAALGEGNV